MAEAQQQRRDATATIDPEIHGRQPSLSRPRARARSKHHSKVAARQRHACKPAPHSGRAGQGLRRRKKFLRRGRCQRKTRRSRLQASQRRQGSGGRQTQQRWGQHAAQCTARGPAGPIVSAWRHYSHSRPHQRRAGAGRAPPKTSGKPESGRRATFPAGSRRARRLRAGAMCAGARGPAPAARCPSCTCPRAGYRQANDCSSITQDWHTRAQEHHMACAARRGPGCAPGDGQIAPRPPAMAAAAAPRPPREAGA